MDIDNKPSIEKMNEMIGIYMGGSWSNDDFGGRNPRRFNLYSRGLGQQVYFINTEHLNYHKDWNQLMEVVIKISSMPLLNADGTISTDVQAKCYPITFNMPAPPDGKQVLFRFMGFSCHQAYTLIEAVFNACYEIAEWENSKSKSNEQ